MTVPRQNTRTPEHQTQKTAKRFLIFFTPEIDIYYSLYKLPEEGFLLVGTPISQSLSTEISTVFEQLLNRKPTVFEQEANSFANMYIIERARTR